MSEETEYLFDRSDSLQAIADAHGVSRQYVHRNRPRRPKPEFDADGYPTEETLSVVKQWEIRSSFTAKDLIAYVREAWRWPNFWRRSKGVWRVSTGGWSGNESLVSAMESNQVFWVLVWLESKRGGHYKLRALGNNPSKKLKSNDSPIDA